MHIEQSSLVLVEARKSLQSRVRTIVDAHCLLVSLRSLLTDPFASYCIQLDDNCVSSELMCPQLLLGTQYRHPVHDTDTDTTTSLSLAISAIGPSHIRSAVIAF